MKDLQGKQRCWLKKVLNPVEESQRKEILFTMIDMKLVSRVLQMYTISSSQLKWCQEKLDNIEFKEGKVFRVCSSTGPLFPLSWLSSDEITKLRICICPIKSGGNCQPFKLNFYIIYVNYPYVSHVIKICVHFHQSVHTLRITITKYYL